MPFFFSTRGLTSGPQPPPAPPTGGRGPRDEHALRIEHYERLADSVRRQMSERMSQRDSYFIQATVLTAALIGLAGSGKGGSGVLTAALVAIPLVAIAYTALILYSMRIHYSFAAYLKKVVEPELARQHGIDLGHEFENWLETRVRGGSAGWRFYVRALWVTLTVDWAALLVLGEGGARSRTLEGLAVAFYAVLALALTFELAGRQVRVRVWRGSD